MSNASILIIDDEAQIRKLLSITLQAHNYKVSEAATAREGLQLVANHPPDLVLLDIGLPDESGQDVLKHLRDWFRNPIIIVSVHSGEDDIVRALDSGANDYLTKPFRSQELLARIRTALRNAAGQQNQPVAKFNDLSVDFANRVVKKSSAIVKLTTTEYSILALFARNEGKVLTHHYLLDQVWGPTHRSESQYLRVFIGQLRKKIEHDPTRPAYILTESGVGYRFMGNGPSGL